MPENQGMISISWAWVWGGIMAWMGVLHGMIFGRVSREEFKQYLDGAEKLNEAHVKNTDANTDAIIKLHERVDDKEDKGKK